MANFKDFLIDESAYKEADNVKQKRKKTEITFETVFVSGPDWAVRRKTTRTSQLLCFMTSANQFYIKNEKNGDIEKVTQANLNSFLRSADSVPIEDENGDSPFWIDFLSSESGFREELYAVSVSETRQKLCCSGYAYMGSSSAGRKLAELENILGASLLKRLFNSLSDTAKKAFRYYVSYYSYYGSNSYGAYTPNGNDPEVAKIRTLIDDLANDRRWSKDALSFLQKDEVNYLVERYMDSPATSFPNVAQVVYKNWNPRSNPKTAEKRLNVRKAIDHIFDSGIEQGYADDLDNFADCWKDYLNHQEDVYGKLVEKYPDNLASSEKRLSYVYNQRRAQIDERKFNEMVEKAKVYRDENEYFILTSPETRVDLIDEGRKMSNCIGGYVNNIIEGYCMIFFLRKKSAPETPFVDIEVHQDGSLGQVRAKYNKSPSYEALDFVREWHAEHFLKKELKTA